jgi:hypothetical protein
MRGSFGARHLAALCAHRMGALYQVVCPDREQRRRPSVTGEIPCPDLVLRQQAARPRRSGLAQELGQGRVYCADPDTLRSGASAVVTRRRHKAMMCDGQSMSVGLGRCRTMCTMGHGHYGAGFCRMRRTIMGTAATTAVERHAAARDPRCVGFADRDAERQCRRARGSGASRPRRRSTMAA